MAAGVYVGTQWQMLPMITTYYLISILSLLETGFIPALRLTSKSNAAQNIIIISSVQFIFVFLAGYAENENVIHLLILSILGIILGASYVYAMRNSYFHLFTGSFIAIFFYIFCQQYLRLTDTPYILGLVYTIMGVIWYGTAIKYKQDKEIVQTGLIITAAYFCLAIILSFSFPGYIAFILFIFAFLAYSASWYLRKSEAIYISNIALSIGLGELLYYFQASSWIFPLVYSGFYFVLYSISTVVRTHNQPYYYRSALTGSILVPIVYSFFLSWQFQPQPNLELTCIISAYTATILYSLHAISRRSLHFGYAASAIGMCTYYWQMNYIGVTNIQLYTLLSALYLFAIGYTRRLRDDETSRQLFDVLGMLFLFTPTLFQSFSDTNGIIYTLLLLVEGTVVVLVGNSLRYKPFLYGGTSAIVIAIIARTYQYIILLPWWVIVGIIGLLFLSTAIFLLSKRTQ